MMSEETLSRGHGQFLQKKWKADRINKKCGIQKLEKVSNQRIPHFLGKSVIKHVESNSLLPFFAFVPALFGYTKGTL